MAKYAFEPGRIRHVIAAQKKKKADKKRKKVQRGMKVAADEEEVNGEPAEGQDYSVHSVRSKDDNSATSHESKANSNAITALVSTEATSTASVDSSAKNEKHNANTNMSLAKLTKSEKIEISGMF